MVAANRTICWAMQVPLPLRGARLCWQEKWQFGFVPVPCTKLLLLWLAAGVKGG